MVLFGLVCRAGVWRAFDGLAMLGRGKVNMPVTKSNRLGSIGGTVPTNGGDYGVELQQPYRVSVTIEGVAELLFHAWNCESVESKGKAAKGSKEKKTDDVESFVYRNDKKEICIPGTYLTGSIVNAAKFQQDPRSPRKSAMDLFKAAIVPLTPLASLGKVEWDYLDKRRVVIQRNAVTRSRPAFHAGWKASFVLMCNLPEYVPSQLLNQTIAAAGRLIGVGDFRPTFGRFSVISFELLDD
jgi:hypothetical protein